MRSKTYLALAAGCAVFMAFDLPAFSRPLPNGADTSAVPTPRAKPKIPVQRQATVERAPAPVQRQAVIERGPAPEPISFSARMKPPFGTPDLVAEARKYMGTNPTDRKKLWCATFMNFVLAKVGYTGTNSDAAKSFAYYGRRISEPRVGAIAVLTRGKNGGHVGVVSGVDKQGNPVIISGNHNKRVGEAVYARSRVIAYVMPSERRATPTQVAARGPASSPLPELGIESPIAELLAAIEAEQARPERPRPQAAPQAQQQPVQPQRQAPPPVPHRVVQQSAEPIPGHAQPGARGAAGDPFSELFSRFERGRAEPVRGHIAAAETGRGIR
ncbi:MAG: TIGR02594 family protein [Pseudolabrys sp.]